MEEQFEREERLSYDPFTVSDAFGPLGNLLLKGGCNHAFSYIRINAYS